MAKKKPAPKKSALDPRGDKSKAGIGKKRKSSQVGKSQNPPKYKKTSSQTRTAKAPPKTSAGKAQGASKNLTPGARKVSKKPRSQVNTKAPTKKKVAKTVAKKVVTSGIGRAAVSMAARAIPVVAAPILAFSALAQMTDKAFKRKPGEKGRSIKTKNFSIKPVDTAPFGISLGKQITPDERVKRAVDTSAKPDPKNTPEEDKGTLGRQVQPGKSLKDMEKLTKISTKGISSGTGQVDDDDATSKQSKKPAKQRKSKGSTAGIANQDQDLEYNRNLLGRQSGKPLPKASKPKSKTPVAEKRITKDFDTTMGVYGWNNLTNSFGYLGTEKEVGKYGASTYFTKGFKRGSRVEGYKKKKSA